MVIDRIEDELIKKYHLDHITNGDGRSPYRGRAEGLVLKKQEMVSEKNGETRDNYYPAKALKAAIQKLNVVKDLVRKSNKTDVIEEVKKVIQSVEKNIDTKYSEHMVPHAQLMEWYKGFEEDSETDASGLALIMGKV